MPKIKGTMKNIVVTTDITIEVTLYFFWRNSGETRFINIAATISINIQTPQIFKNKKRTFSVKIKLPPKPNRKKCPYV